MANYMFNIGKGRFVEWFNRVAANDPTNSQIVLVPLSASDTEANRQDDADLATFLAAAPNEQTAGGWVRKLGRDAGGDFVVAAITVDNVNNRFPATIPQITFTAPAAPNNTTGLFVGYDADSAAGTDSNVFPICHLDMVVTADGNDVIINAGDIARAS